MSVRLPRSRGDSEKSPAQSVSPRVVIEGQYPTIVESSSLPYISPSKFGSSTPKPVPVTVGAYRQLINDMAALQANNTSQSSFHHSTTGLQWSNHAEQKFHEIRNLLGTEPNLMIPRPQGVALWYHPTKNYHSFEVRDQGKPFVVRLPISLRENTIKHLYKIAPEAWYERYAGLVGVQDDSLEQAILTLVLIKSYDQDQRLPEEIKKAAEREWKNSIGPYPVRDALERYIMTDN